MFVNKNKELTFDIEEMKILVSVVIFAQDNGFFDELNEDEAERLYTIKLALVNSTKEGEKNND